MGMKKNELGETCIIPVQVLGNGEVHSFRVDPDSDHQIRGSRLRRASSGRILAVFDDSLHASRHVTLFPGCERATFAMPDDAFDVSLPQEETDENDDERA